MLVEKLHQNDRDFNLYSTYNENQLKRKIQWPGGGKMMLPKQFLSFYLSHFHLWTQENHVVMWCDSAWRGWLYRKKDRKQHLVFASTYNTLTDPEVEVPSFQYPIKSRTTDMYL